MRNNYNSEATENKVNYIIKELGLEECRNV